MSDADLLADMLVSLVCLLFVDESSNLARSITEDIIEPQLAIDTYDLWKCDSKRPQMKARKRKPESRFEI